MNDADISESQEKPLILIVDDVPTNLQVLTGLLNQRACEIAVAINGEDALELIDTILPDLILLDIVMPNMNGLEVCERLQASPRTKEIPIIFLTAKNETKDVVKGFETGAMDYVAKPFNSTELLARVNTHLELKKARDTQKELIFKLQEKSAEIKKTSKVVEAASKRITESNRVRPDDPEFPVAEPGEYQNIPAGQLFHMDAEGHCGGRFHFHGAFRGELCPRGD